MRASISVLGLTALLCASQTAQQIANSAADNKSWGQVSTLFG